MRTCEEEVAEEDVGVLAAEGVEDVDELDGHEEGDGLREDEGGARPGEHLDLPRDVHHEDVALVGAARQGGLDLLHDLLGLRGEEVEGGEDGAVGTQLVLLHHLPTPISTFL